MIRRGQTIQELIGFIAMMDNVDINELWFDGMVLLADESFDDFYESKGRVFVFSKVSAANSTTRPVTPPPSPSPSLAPPRTPVATRPSRSPAQTSPSASPAGGCSVSDYVGDFQELR
jgi:hypothetical protein